MSNQTRHKARYHNSIVFKLPVKGLKTHSHSMFFLYSNYFLHCILILMTDAVNKKVLTNQNISVSHTFIYLWRSVTYLFFILGAARPVITQSRQSTCQWIALCLYTPIQWMGMWFLVCGKTNKEEEDNLTQLAWPKEERKNMYPITII